MSKDAKVALVVGINKYSNVQGLNFCASDADQVSQALQLPEYGFITTVILDEQATKIRIIEEIEKCRELNPSIFLFYFSGHGCITNSGAILVTTDAKEFDEGINFHELESRLKVFSDHGTTVLIILDCCHAGVASLFSNTEYFSRERLEPDITNKRDASRVILAACQPNNYSYEDAAKRQSLFTYYLLDGLTGAATNYDGEITIQGIYEFVSKPFEAITKQKPIFKALLNNNVVLGSGFAVSKSRPADKVTSEIIEKKSMELIREYHDFQIGSNHDYFRAEGYKKACQLLERINDWFVQIMAKHQNMIEKANFNRSFISLNAERQKLGAVIPGTHIAHGILSLQIGSGAFGTVWKVTPHNEVNRSLAYKIFHPHELENSSKVERFKRGHKAMQSLDHPNIVKVYESTNCPYGFFMDYIDGPNMAQQGMNNIELIDRVRMLLVIADTITHAHERSVVHRDIKPENILLSYKSDESKWLPFLTDFDLAWFSSAASLTTSAFGTLYYASPEQRNNPDSKKARSKLVDIFSFGRLCYYSITSTAPTHIDHAILNNYFQQQLHSWPSSAAATMMRDLFTNCTSERQESRISSFTEIKSILSGIIAELATSSSEDVELTYIKFLDSIAFSLSNFNHKNDVERDSIVFNSISGRVKIGVSVNKERTHSKGCIVFSTSYSFNSGMSMEQMSTADARRTLNQRVDKVIAGNRDIARVAGSHGAYEVYVNFTNIPATRAGANRCVMFISKIISCLENN